MRIRYVSVCFSVDNRLHEDLTFCTQKSAPHQGATGWHGRERRSPIQDIIQFVNDPDDIVEGQRDDLSCAIQ